MLSACLDHAWVSSCTLVQKEAFMAMLCSPPPCGPRLKERHGLLVQALCDRASLSGTRQCSTLPEGAVGTVPVGATRWRSPLLHARCWRSGGRGDAPTHCRGM